MLDIESRPMTPDERARVEPVAREAEGGYRDGCVTYFIFLAGGMIVGMFVTVAVVALCMALLRKPLPVPLEFLPLGSIWGILLGLWKLRKDASEYALPYRRDLLENRVQEMRCTPLEAVEVEPFEDEGTGFFLDVGDSKLLFLQGQYLDDLIEEGGFPRRQLHLVRTPYGGVRLIFECTGETFSPSRVLGTDDIEYIPADGEILVGQLASLEQDLRRRAQAEGGRAGRR